MEDLRDFTHLQKHSKDFFDTKTRNQFHYPKIFFQKEAVVYDIFKD